MVLAALCLQSDQTSRNDLRCGLLTHLCFDILVRHQACTHRCSCGAVEGQRSCSTGVQTLSCGAREGRRNGGAGKQRRSYCSGNGGLQLRYQAGRTYLGEGATCLTHCLSLRDVCCACSSSQ